MDTKVNSEMAEEDGGVDLMGLKPNP